MAKQALDLPKGTIVPNHIAVILDGNGRWARSRGLPVTKGHEAGAKAIREVMDAARGAGVHTISIWGFSTENWKRPPREVAKIMELVSRTIKIELDYALKQDVRFIHIGRKDRLPKPLVMLIEKAEEKTKNNQKYILNVALDYGGRDEILRAIKKASEAGEDMKDLSEEDLSKYLDTADQPYPNPDLLIRTSGEQRTSGFLPWQMAYAEFYFEEDHLPSMNTAKLRKIILDYSCRRRRYGGKDRVFHFKFKPELTAQFELNWWRLANIPEDKTFGEYARQHLAEQWGLSKKLASEAAVYWVSALAHGKKENWKKARVSLKDFYKLIKEEVKLAFEPSIAASLELKVLQKLNGGSRRIDPADIEEENRKFISEVYRISALQAKKAARLRTLATVERNRAQRGEGEEHWKLAGQYLEKYYQELKNRVA